MKQLNQARIKIAEGQFEAAREVAAQSGLILKKNNEVHYSLILKDGHKFELYPSNQRVWKKWRGAPFLNVPDEWGLFDAVRAGINIDSDYDPEANALAHDANREMGIDETLVDGDWGDK